MNQRPYHVGILGYLALITMNLMIVDAPEDLTKELLPIWAPWICIWASIALGSLWLHTAVATSKPRLRYLMPIAYTALALAWGATDHGQDWLAYLIPLNALIALSIASSMHAYRLKCQQPQAITRDA